jgi:hypothetical protein
VKGLIVSFVGLSCDLLNRIDVKVIYSDVWDEPQFGVWHPDVAPDG